MISRDNISGLLAVLAGMLIFKSTTYISQVEAWIQEFPLIVIGVALLLFFQRFKIADKIGGKKG